MSGDEASGEELFGAPSGRCWRASPSPGPRRARAIRPSRRREPCAGCSRSANSELAIDMAVFSAFVTEPEVLRLIEDETAPAEQAPKPSKRDAAMMPCSRRYREVVSQERSSPRARGRRRADRSMPARGTRSPRPVHGRAHRGSSCGSPAASPPGSACRTARASGRTGGAASRRRRQGRDPLLDPAQARSAVARRVELMRPHPAWASGSSPTPRAWPTSRRRSAPA